MTTSFSSLSRVTTAAAVAASCLLATTLTSPAQDHTRAEYAQNSVVDFIQSIGGNFVRRESNQRREVDDREYYRRESRDYDRRHSTAADVQNALARRGYYRGSIDGSLGRQSRQAIARYQEDRGLQVTGDINSSLLRSLGIR